MVTICVKAKQKEWEDNMDNILPEMDARRGVNLLLLTFCLAACAFSHSSTSVSINSAKWPSDLDIKGEILFHHQNLKYQYPCKTEKLVRDSMICQNEKNETSNSMREMKVKL